MGGTQTRGYEGPNCTRHTTGLGPLSALALPPLCSFHRKPGPGDLREGLFPGIWGSPERKTLLQWLARGRRSTSVSPTIMSSKKAPPPSLSQMPPWTSPHWLLSNVSTVLSLNSSGCAVSQTSLSFPLQAIVLSQVGIALFCLKSCGP